MSRNENLINRRNLRCDETGDSSPSTNNNNNNQHLTLIEQVFLLSLHDGKVSFWNDSLSASLRGCILIELCLLGRIDLEPRSGRARSLLNRKVRMKDDTPTGERILDETLKHLKIAPEPNGVAVWLEFLNGENWNPWNWRYQLRNVKDRLAKDLVEKGVLFANKENYVVFERIVYPFRDDTIRMDLKAKLLAGLLGKWPGRIDRLNFKTIGLILMSYAGDLCETILADLNPASYSTAKRRLNEMLDADYEKIAEKKPGFDVIWAVFTVLLK